MFFTDGWGAFIVFTFESKSYHEDHSNERAKRGVNSCISPVERESCLPQSVPQTLGRLPTVATRYEAADGSL